MKSAFKQPREYASRSRAEGWPLVLLALALIALGAYQLGRWRACHALHSDWLSCVSATNKAWLADKADNRECVPGPFGYVVEQRH